MEPANRQPLAIAPTNTPDWVQVARARLDELVRVVAAVKVAQDEAERIWRALSAAEVADLPVLPWRASKTPKVTGGQTGPRGFRCSRCGKMLQSGESKRDGGIHGPYVCRENCPALIVSAA